MIDLSTLAGQAEHYGAVRERLMGQPTFKPVRVKQPVALSAPVPTLRQISADDECVNRWRKLFLEPISEVHENPAPRAPLGQWDELEQSICDEFQTSRLELRSERKHDSIVAARRKLYFRAFIETDMSMAAISRRVNKNHSTVITGIRAYLREHPEDVPTYESIMAARGERESRRDRLVRHLYFGLGKSVKATCILAGVGRDRVERILFEAQKASAA